MPVRNNGFLEPANLSFKVSRTLLPINCEQNSTRIRSHSALHRTKKYLITVANTIKESDSHKLERNKSGNSIAKKQVMPKPMPER